MLFSLHAKNHIYFVAFPEVRDCASERLDVISDGPLSVLTPVLPRECSAFERKDMLLDLVRNFISDRKLSRYRFVTSTCRAVPYLRHLQPDLVVYDENEEEAKLYPELFIEMAEYAD